MLTNPTARRELTLNQLPMAGLSLGDLGPDPEAVTAHIMELLVASKKERLGAKPTPAAAAALRAIVLAYVQRGEPVPALSVCAPCKLPDFEQPLDVAEMIMLRRLALLAEQVRRVYPPGLQINLRIEDLTVLSCMPQAMQPRLRPSIERYVQGLRDLNRTLGYEASIHLVAESDLAVETEFMAKVAELSPLFRAYLDETNDAPPGHEQFASYQALNAVGWRFDISAQQREYVAKKN